MSILFCCLIAEMFSVDKVELDKVEPDANKDAARMVGVKRKPTDCR